MPALYRIWYGRLRFGSGVGTDAGRPNVRFVEGPSSLSCAMSSPLRSTHVRVSAAPPIGLKSSPRFDENDCTYLPMLPLTAVLPLPNRSYDAPKRGLT